MKKRQLIIIRGLPGSGKSTLARKLKKRSWEHWETDMYWITEDGEYEFDRSRISEAHEWCYDRVINTLENKKSCIVSNTFTTMDEMENYINLAEDYDVKLTIINCRGVFGSDKGVPPEVIERMEDRWEEVDEDWEDCVKEWDGEILE